MRLIDADECERFFYEHLDDNGMSGAMNAINEMPTIDAESVVRCKNCKWWTKQEASLQGRCDAYGMYPTGEWYCARGERQ